MWKIVKQEWNGRGVFLGRGNFSELMLGLAESMTGVHILLVGTDGIKQSMLLDRFEDIMPTWVAGMLWTSSGFLTLIGIGLYCLGYRTTAGYRIESWIRLLGALGSIYVWLSAGLVLFPSPFVYIYFLAALAAMRITNIVWRK